MSQRTDKSRRKLLDTAGDLFFHEGYRAVGVDTIALESGIGKMTLYRHFASKDALIQAFLEESDAEFWAAFEHFAGLHPNDPKQQLADFFDGLENYVKSDSCQGCAFLNVAVDFPDRDHPAHQFAAAHKKKVRLRLGALVSAAGLPAEVADDLFLLMDGAMMSRRMFGTESPGSRVAAAARRILGMA